MKHNINYKTKTGISNCFFRLYNPPL